MSREGGEGALLDPRGRQVGAHSVVHEGSVVTIGTVWGLRRVGCEPRGGQGRGYVDVHVGSVVTIGTEWGLERVGCESRGEGTECRIRRGGFNLLVYERAGGASVLDRMGRVMVSGILTLCNCKWPDAKRSPSPMLSMRVGWRQLCNCCRSPFVGSRTMFFRAQYVGRRVSWTFPSVGWFP